MPRCAARPEPVGPALFGGAAALRRKSNRRRRFRGSGAWPGGGAGTGVRRHNRGQRGRASARRHRRPRPTRRALPPSVPPARPPARLEYSSTLPSARPPACPCRCAPRCRAAMRWHLRARRGGAYGDADVGVGARMLDVARHHVHAVLLQLEVGAAAQLDLDLPAVEAVSSSPSSAERGSAQCHAMACTTGCAQGRGSRRRQAALPGATARLRWPARRL